MQGCNVWNENTLQVIAWKSLSLDINQINHTVLITKIFNHLLPTETNLKKRKWKSHNNCIIFKQKETMEYLI